jgi:hypothetical protein
MVRDSLTGEEFPVHPMALEAPHEADNTRFFDSHFLHAKQKYDAVRAVVNDDYDEAYVQQHHQYE